MLGSPSPRLALALDIGSGLLPITAVHRSGHSGVAGEHRADRCRVPYRVDPKEQLRAWADIESLNGFGGHRQLVPISELYFYNHLWHLITSSQSEN